MKSLFDTRTVLQMRRDATVGPRDGCLVKIHPADSLGRLMNLGSSRVTIGRDAACEVELPDDSVSRKHASIERGERGFRIDDLGSTNGTYVNEERVEHAILQAGDRIRLGNQILKFLSADDIETQYHETAYQMMTTDGLTGACNKRHLLDCLERETARAARHGRPLCLLMLDIDHFKHINDRYGHLAGDAVLQELCRRVQGVLRKDEILARYGGEEFAVVMPEAALDEARQVAERLRNVVRETPFLVEAGRIAATVSGGIAQTLGDAPTTPAQLIAQADEQLYRAKREGRDRICA